MTTSAYGADVREERSAGIIMYRVAEDGRRLYLVLMYAAGHWDFAKGKKEKGESDMQTALREVREETGIADVAVLDGFEREIEYEFMDNGAMIHKTVIFFLGHVRTEEEKEVTLSDEHQDYAWLEYDDASFAITHAAARAVLADAEEALRDGIADMHVQ